MKITLCEKGKSFWWKVLATNGNVLLTSETYENKATRTRVAKNFSTKTGLPVAEEVCDASKCGSCKGKPKAKKK
jgi:hypothetical protein